jgi:TMEM175 potassium channel family protein
MSSDRRELDRLNAFSDGVFAIAITLLVLNIEIPSVPGDELVSALSDLWDDLLAYMIGFAVIGLFWFGHHRLFSRLVRSDGRLVLVNMLLLGLIGLMPFTTGLLGRYDEPIAVALYAANVGIATLVDGAIHILARVDGLEAEGVDHEKHELLLTALRAAVFFVSIPVAYVASTGLAQWLWLLLVGIVFLRRWG